MKYCPQCHRVEADEALKFCRVDRAMLVGDSSAIGNEAGNGRAEFGARRERSSYKHPSAKHRC